MKEEKLNSVKIIRNTPEENKMLQEVIEQIKDVPAFLEKKAAILESVKKMKQGEGELQVVLSDVESERT